jgi:hypothetical protein
VLQGCFARVVAAVISDLTCQALLVFSHLPAMKLLPAQMNLLVVTVALEELLPAPRKVLLGLQWCRPDVMAAVEVLEYLTPATSSALHEVLLGFQ